MGPSLGPDVRYWSVSRPLNMLTSAKLTDATLGGSATMAVEVLKSRGVPENRILFLNLIASPEGVGKFAKKFPLLKVVTAFIDEVCDCRIPNCYSMSNCFFRVSMKRSPSFSPDHTTRAPFILVESMANLCAATSCPAWVTSETGFTPSNAGAVW